MIRQYRLLLGAAVLVSVTSSVAAVATISSADTPPRVIAYEPDVPIVSRVEPGDKVLLVKKLESGHGAANWEKYTPEEILGLLAGINEGTVFVDVEDASGMWMEDGAWIGTSVRAYVVEAVAREGSRIKKGERLSLTWAHGGELWVGDTLVRAGIPPAVSDGQRYFMFLTRNSPENWFPSRIMRVQDDRLESTYSADRQKEDQLDGFSASTAMRVIGRFVNR